jgi:drug/metabolite transporter (DMT)-like permease
VQKWLIFGAWTLILGWGFLFTNIATDQISPIELTTARAVIAMVGLLVFVQVRGIALPSGWAVVKAYIVLGVANRSLTFILFAWAQQQGVSSGLSGVLVATNPLFTVMIAHVAFADERLTVTKIVGVLLGFAGVIILASRNIDGTQVALDNLLGQGAIVLAALLFAWTTVYTRQTLRDQPVSPLALAVGASTVSGVFMIAWFLVSLLFGATLPAISTLQTDTLVSIFMLGVFNTLIAVVLANYVIRELGASRANMQAYIVPIIALVLGAIFLDEVIDLTVITGSVVILLGVAIATFGSRMGRALKLNRQSNL